MEGYIESAPHPSASVIGQELFQGGFVPSDTDFRIFRDYGKLSGLDMAYVDNGYVYHTKYYAPVQIPMSTIQHTGENLLAIVKTYTSLDLENVPHVENSMLRMM